MKTFRSLCTQVLLVACAPLAIAADSADTFVKDVEPYVEKYCIECHRGQDAKGELDLAQYSQSSHVVANFRRWNNVIEFIRNGEMPPKDAARQPSIDESNTVVASIEAILIE